MTLAQTHRAAVLHGAKDLRIEEVQTLPPKPHEVQIVPRATGICGTDQHYYQNGRNGIYQVTSPLVLGHEAAGEVVAVGAAVTSLKVGDRVAVEPQLACSSCQHCRQGHYNLCQQMRFNGSASASPPAQGSLQMRLNHPAHLCYRLPDEVSFEEGAMVEPLSVAIHSVRKAQPQAGQSVLITGAGGIGLLCARIAKISGASSVTMVDVDEARLAFAVQHGLADATFKMPLSPGEGEMEALVEQVRRAAATGRPADYALECTGVETCLNLCIGSVVAGARIILVGMGRPLQQVNLGVALVREIQILGVWRYTNTFEPAIELIRAGLVDVKPMVTHRYVLEDVVDALELALKRPPDLIKCLLVTSL